MMVDLAEVFDCFFNLEKYAAEASNETGSVSFAIILPYKLIERMCVVCGRISSPIAIFASEII